MASNYFFERRHEALREQLSSVQIASKTLAFLIQLSEIV